MVANLQYEMKRLNSDFPRYASIGAVLMSQKIADGIRDQNGFWKHGHTYQVTFHLHTEYS